MSISLKQLSVAHEQELASIYRSYCTAFPEDERRSAVSFYQLLQKPEVKFYQLFWFNEWIGYALFWQLSDFYFLEHFEIFPEYRGKQLGSLVLDYFKNQLGCIVLESESSHLNDTAKRRIEFYKRNGFMILTQDYIQPAYDCSKSSVPLFLLSNQPLDHLRDKISAIHSVVYQV